MVNFKNKFYIIAIIILFTIICILYPKKGSIDKFIYSYSNITEVNIRSTKLQAEKNIKDKEEITKIRFKLSDISIKEYYGSISNRTKGTYYITFYENDNVKLQISILGKEYIHIFDSANNTEKNYKIVDNNLIDTNYINQLILE